MTAGVAVGVAGAVAVAVAVARSDVPVDPGAAEAQRLLLQELSKPEYRASQPTWFDRLVTAIRDFFDGLTAPAGSPASGLGLPIILGIVVIALVVVFLVFGLPRLNRRSRVTGALFGVDDQRTSREMRATARAAAASGDFTTAIAEGFRAIARGLTERDLVVTSPGTTAHGFATRAGGVFPSLTPDLKVAASDFDTVRYLGQGGTEAGWNRIEKLADQLASTRPNLDLQPA